MKNYLVVALLMTVTACGSGIDKAEVQAFEAARAQWSAADIDDYSYTFKRRCECISEFLGPFDVRVVNGGVELATRDGVDLLDIENLNGDSYESTVPTVEAIFETIEQGIDEAHSVAVEYDSEFGYPTRVSIDWDEGMADDESSYTVEGLVVG